MTVFQNVITVTRNPTRIPELCRLSNYIYIYIYIYIHVVETHKHGCNDIENTFKQVTPMDLHRKAPLLEYKSLTMFVPLQIHLPYYHTFDPH